MAEKPEKSKDTRKDRKRGDLTRHSPGVRACDQCNGRRGGCETCNYSGYISII